MAASPASVPQRNPTEGAWDQVQVCVDDLGSGSALLPYAIIVSTAIGATVELFKVVPSAFDGSVPADPIAARLRVADAERELNELTNIGALGDLKVSTRTIEGLPKAHLCPVRPVEPDAVVLIARHEVGPDAPFSQVARCFLDDAEQSILVVPERSSKPTAGLRRVLVPLDGSYRGEKALHSALELEADEIQLVHVLGSELGSAFPVPDQTIAGLEEQLREARERRAYAYLSGLAEAFSNGGSKITFAVTSSTQVPTAIAEHAERCETDLIVLEGHAAGAASEVPCGHVARHLVEHASTPVLLCRRTAEANGGSAQRSDGSRTTLRLPEGAGA